MAIAGDFDDLTFDCDSTRNLGPYGGTIESVEAEVAIDDLATWTGTVDGETRTGVMIEGSRTNYNTRCQEIDHADWSTTSLTMTADTTDIDDPLGGSTAEKVELIVEAGSHKSSRGSYILGTAPIAVSVFAQDNGAYCHMGVRNDKTSPDFPYISVDLSDGSIDSADVTNDSQGTENAGDSWYYMYFTYGPTSVGNTSYNLQPQETAQDYQGWWEATTTDGCYWWQAQIEVGPWPSSIIPTTSSSVTRDAADAYWDEGDVDSNLRGEIVIYVIPAFSSSMLFDADTEQTVIHFDDATQDYRLYFEKGVSAGGRLILYGASAVITTGDLAWDRGQALKITLNPNDGSNSKITCALFTTGNGSYTGTTYSTDDGDVWLGRDASGGDYFDGVIFEPEYEEGTVTLEGTAESESNGNGDLACERLVIGIAESDSNASGDLSIGRSLTGVAESDSNADGDLAKAVALTGIGESDSNADGNIARGRGVAGVAGSESDANADLACSRPLSGTAESDSNADGTLSVAKPFTGTAESDSNADGTLAVDRSLQGTAESDSNADGELTIAGVVKLDGIAESESNGNAALSTTRAFSATAESNSNADGIIVIARALSGAAESLSNADAVMSRGRLFEGVAESDSDLDGELSVSRPLAGVAESDSNADGELKVTSDIVSFTGIAESLSNASGLISINRGMTGIAESDSDAYGLIFIYGAARDDVQVLDFDYLDRPLDIEYDDKTQDFDYNDLVRDLL